MKGRCPASGTVVPADRRGEDPRLKVARCAACGRIITVARSGRHNYEPTYRDHVTSPAPTVFNRPATSARGPL